MVQGSTSSKIILFLDDSPERMATAASKMKQEDCNRVIWCKTAEEAIITIRDYFDCLEVMFLDHDLGVEEQNFKSPESGMEVVRYLETNRLVTKELIHAGCKIIIHSWNAAAGKIMVERLQTLGFWVRYQPFGT